MYLPIRLFETINLWINTLKDIPIFQLVDRCWFIVRCRIFQYLHTQLKLYWIGCHGSAPSLQDPYLKELYVSSLEKDELNLSNQYVSLEFSFIGKSEILPYPIVWNSQNYSRLWQFNLHYFDWIRDDLNHLYTTGVWSDLGKNRLGLIRDWINNNPLGSMDGWHPYTISLRLINWTWLIRSVPELQTPILTESMWIQFCYLNHYQETFLRGNHWFENLSSLIIVGLNFNGSQAKKIVQKSIENLNNELSVQILDDGGHFERSPMYHLILLKRLWEVITCLNSAGWNVPPSYLKGLSAMVSFAERIRLHNGTYPLWNDCAYNISQSLDEVVACAKLVLGLSPSTSISSFNHHLITCGQGKGSLEKGAAPSQSTQLSGMEVFLDSGYFLIRLGKAEITFDAALPCPPSLPAHAHSDCLNVDLYWLGKPLIVETGTSQYDGGVIRQQERGTLGHNTLAFAPIGSDLPYEQTQVWGNFRAARKATPKLLDWGSHSSVYWIAATHSGYDWLPASHYRWLGCSQSDGFFLIICDWMESNRSLKWLHRLHLGPEVAVSQQSHGWQLRLGDDNFRLHQLSSNFNTTSKLTPNSWYSPQFGCRFPRSVITTSGIVTSDNPLEVLCTILTLNSALQFTIHGDPKVGWISCNGSPVVRWDGVTGIPAVKYCSSLV